MDMEVGCWRVDGDGDGGRQISDFGFPISIFPPNVLPAGRRVASRHFDMENDHTIDTPR